MVVENMHTEPFLESFRVAAQNRPRELFWPVTTSSSTERVSNHSNTLNSQHLVIIRLVRLVFTARIERSLRRAPANQTEGRRLLSVRLNSTRIHYRKRALVWNDFTKNQRQIIEVGRETVGAGACDTNEAPGAFRRISNNGKASLRNQSKQEGRKIRIRSHKETKNMQQDRVGQPKKKTQIGRKMQTKRAQSA